LIAFLFCSRRASLGVSYIACAIDGMTMLAFVHGYCPLGIDNQRLMVGGEALRLLATGDILFPLNLA
jgi:hypothetical protein